MVPGMTVPILLPAVSPPWENIPPQSPGSIPEHPPLCSGNGEEIPNPCGRWVLGGIPQILPPFQKHLLVSLQLTAPEV